MGVKGVVYPHGGPDAGEDLRSVVSLWSLEDWTETWADSSSALPSGSRSIARPNLRPDSGLMESLWPEAESEPAFDVDRAGGTTPQAGSATPRGKCGRVQQCAQFAGVVLARPGPRRRSRKYAAADTAVKR